MTSRINVNVFYVSDSSPGSCFKRIYAIKTINDKIEELNFNLECRMERRNDIDMIIKKFDSITVCIIEKEIILRLTNDSIKIMGMKRSRGVTFELVKGVMARLSLFDGVDATLYCATREISSAHDSIEEATDLPSFATALNRDEIELRFEERKKRREERESGKFDTPLKDRKQNTPKTKSIKDQNTPQKSSKKLDDAEDVSKQIEQRIISMDMEDGSDHPDSGGETDENEDEKDAEIVFKVDGKIEGKRSRSYPIRYVDQIKTLTQMTMSENIRNTGNREF
ncbi:uncharacterized protein LOC112686885 [Sipha flava]|uniref:Uncharacterized protein LOC112686885 n=1 Tax=Sipha flava TaxID=143950 RepID=A0A8B8FXQ8_9HEMI|nr:uncharacterized protein LOC112686885 [Sipha flava]